MCKKFSYMMKLSTYFELIYIKRSKLNILKRSLINALSARKRKNKRRSPLHNFAGIYVKSFPYLFFYNSCLWRQKTSYTLETTSWMFFLCAVDGVSCGKKKMGITINNKQFNPDVATIIWKVYWTILSYFHFLLNIYFHYL